MPAQTSPPLPKAILPGVGFIIVDRFYRGSGKGFGLGICNVASLRGIPQVLGLDVPYTISHRSLGPKPQASKPQAQTWLRLSPKAAASQVSGRPSRVRVRKSLHLHDECVRCHVIVN